MGLVCCMPSAASTRLTYAETDQLSGVGRTPQQAKAARRMRPILNGNREAYVNAGVAGVARKTALNVISVLNRLARHRGDVARADLAKMLSVTGARRDAIVRLLTDPKALEAFRRGGIPYKTVTALLYGVVAERSVEAIQRPAR